jgi:hypothetical protein
VTRIAPIAVALHALLVVAAARADTLIELPKTKARLDLPEGWTAAPAPGVVAIYKHTRGAVLAVTRADVPNPSAWKSETKQAYADDIERGLRAKIAGYKRTSKKLVTAGGVPALDVEATRDSGATVLVRVLLFRTYALALAIEVPKGGDVAVARTIAQTFAPPPET